MNTVIFPGKTLTLIVAPLYISPAIIIWTNLYLQNLIKPYLKMLSRMFRFLADRSLFSKYTYVKIWPTPLNCGPILTPFLANHISTNLIWIIIFYLTMLPHKFQFYLVIGFRKEFFFKIYSIYLYWPHLNPQR